MTVLSGLMMEQVRSHQTPQWSCAGIPVIGQGGTVSAGRPYRTVWQDTRGTGLHTSERHHPACDNAIFSCPLSNDAS